MAKINREDAVSALEDAKTEMDKAETKDEALAVLLKAGQQVGYAPAVRCLAANKSPEDSIRWQ